MSEAKQPSCAELVQQKFNETEQDYKDARDYYDQSEPGEDDQYEGYDSLYDYVNQTALCWDRVEKETFDDQERGYFRLQLSWGGPGDVWGGGERLPWLCALWPLALFLRRLSRGMAGCGRVE